MLGYLDKDDLSRFGNGEPVLAKGDLLPEDVIGRGSNLDLQMISIGNGAYALMQEGTGFVKNNTGETYIIEMGNYFESGTWLGRTPAETVDEDFSLDAVGADVSDIPVDTVSVLGVLGSDSRQLESDDDVPTPEPEVEEYPPLDYFADYPSAEEKIKELSDRSTESEVPETPKDSVFNIPSGRSSLISRDGMDVIDSVVFKGSESVNGAVTPEYLALLAFMEYGSELGNVSVDTSVKNPKSSAKGVFQLIDDSFKDFSDHYELGFTNEDRTDPEAQAIIAAHHTKENRDNIKRDKGITLDDPMSYLAYTVGEGKMEKLIDAFPEMKKLIETNGSYRLPMSDAGRYPADVLPEAASQNPWMYYNDYGDKNTMSEMYREIRNKMKVYMRIIR